MSVDTVVRVSNAVAVSNHQMQIETVVAHHATVGWQCWGESIRFNHARGGAWTQWRAFPMPLQ